MAPSLSRVEKSELKLLTVTSRCECPMGESVTSRDSSYYCRRLFQKFALAASISVVTSIGGCWNHGGTNGNPTATADSKKTMDRPFARFHFTTQGQVIDLAKGRHIVALLSASCDHCMGEVPALNDLVGLGDPPVIALMLGDNKEVQAFREATHPDFSTEPIEALVFFDFFGSGPEEVPPKFFLVDDGIPLKSWKGRAPSIEEIVQFVGR
jgi:hypothetical protein